MIRESSEITWVENLTHRAWATGLRNRGWFRDVARKSLGLVGMKS